MNSYNRIYPSNQTELTFDKYNFSRALCWGGGGRLISKGHILYDLIYFLIGVCCCYLVASVMSDSFATPCTAARQASLSMGFSRQEYWSGLPFPSPKGSKAHAINCGKWQRSFHSTQGPDHMFATLSSSFQGSFPFFSPLAHLRGSV